jgi:hypothetical protein
VHIARERWGVYRWTTTHPRWPSRYSTANAADTITRPGHRSPTPPRMSACRRRSHPKTPMRKKRDEHRGSRHRPLRRPGGKEPPSAGFSRGLVIMRVHKGRFGSDAKRVNWLREGDHHRNERCCLPCQRPVIAHKTDSTCRLDASVQSAGPNHAAHGNHRRPERAHARHRGWS